MKRFFLTATAVMAFAFTNAQEVKFGAKAGINLSTLTGDTEGAKSLVGFHVGGFAEIKLTDKFAIQPELLYSTQGAKYKESGFGYTFESTDNLSYLNVPVMAKYYVIEKLSVEAGPQIGFLLSAKSKYEESDSDGSFSGEEDIKDFTSSIDFGLNFGAGYDFTENLSAGLRYNIGLSNVNDYEDSGDYKVNNGVFSLSAAYKF